MSVNIYARATKLTDVCGRINYATSPDKQENLLATASTVDLPYWKRLANDSQAAFRAAGGAREVKVKGKLKKVRCCEARELVIDLPNSEAEKGEEHLKALAEKIAKDVRRRTGAECLVAIHLNKKKNNMHIHLIFSERERLQEPEIRIADRNAFIDEDGRRRRTKKEILGEDGQMRPGCRIVPKGEVISERYFGEKNPMFKDKGWLYSFKQEMADWINENLDPDEKREVFDKFGPYLAQRHIGDGEREMKETDLEWNRCVKTFNGIVKRGIVTEDYAKKRKTQILLAPDQLQELKSVLSSIYLEAGAQMTPEAKEFCEDMAATAGLGERSVTGPDEELKKKLRDAYHRSAVAWRKYREAAPGSLEQKTFLADARGVSAEIDRLERQLGYDKPITTKERRQAVWDFHMANKAAVMESGNVERLKQAAYDRRSEAWKQFSRQRFEYRSMRPTWRSDEYGNRIKFDPVVNATEDELLDARLAMNVAKNEYQKSRDDIQAFKRAYQIQEEYRRYALQLASDPSVSNEDADRALQKYKTAARRLQNPTTSTCNEMQSQLSDLKRSQRRRDEQASAKMPSLRSKER